MISRKYGCIFIHIPKCAGTSIERSLGLHANGLKRSAQDHRRFITLERSTWPPHRGEFSPIAFAHFLKQRTTAIRRGFDCPSEEEISSFFKFAIVRNPWARVHSWYRNVIRDPVHRSVFGVANNCSFTEFLDRHLDCWALDPQLDWLTDQKGVNRMDFIGRFERLEQSFQEAQELMGRQLPSLPSLLATKDVDYREEYTEELAGRVGQKFRAEIEQFGYEF